MATNAVPSQFLKLLDDILLEILAQLPAFQVVLHCRLVCHKIDQLSRERYLWIRFSRRTEHMLCPPIDRKQIGTLELEINICRIEMLEEKWSSEDALRIVPRFWRGAPQRTWVYHHKCVAIMGDNIVVIQEGVLNWIPIQNINGPPVYSFLCPSIEGLAPITEYTNLRTSTLYLVHLLRDALKIVGIQANPSHGFDVMAEYSVPFRGRGKSSVYNGFVFVYYTRTTTVRLEVDIIDLEESTLSRLSLPPFLQVPQQKLEGRMHFPFDTFATEKHIIEICVEEWFAIFERPAGCPRGPNTNIGSLPLDTISLDPVFEGRFPWPFEHGAHVIPRSATSFAVVAAVIRETVPDSEIHVFFFTISGTTSTMEDICSVGIPRGLYNFVLPIPPPTSRYALGVLGIVEVPPDHNYPREGEGERTHFAVRIDFPDSEGDLVSGNRDSLTLQRMHLTPAANVQEEEEDAEVRFFDCLTGRIWFEVYSKAGVSNLVLDYLSLSC